jgi:hypothetical protein
VHYDATGVLRPAQVPSCFVHHSPPPSPALSYIQPSHHFGDSAADHPYLSHSPAFLAHLRSPAVFLVNAAQQPGAQDPNSRTIGARVYQFYRGGSMPKWLMIGINEFGQSRRFTSILQFKGGQAVSQARNEAEIYYNEQHPLFMEAAKSWTITRSMATVAKYAPRPSVSTWYGMITARARAYAENKRNRKSSSLSIAVSFEFLG